MCTLCEKQVIAEASGVNIILNVSTDNLKPILDSYYQALEEFYRFPAKKDWMKLQSLLQMTMHDHG